MIISLFTHFLPDLKLMLVKAVNVCRLYKEKTDFGLRIRFFFSQNILLGTLTGAD